MACHGKILLSRDCLEKFSAEEIRLILLHEMLHHKRLDPLTHWLSLVVRVLHRSNPPANPPAWLPAARLRTERELAVVVRRTGIAAAPDNGNVILKTVRHYSTILPANIDTWPPDAHLDTYRLGSGDVIGIYIESFTGAPGQPVPVHQPDPGTKLPPATGYPFTVRDDGTIALPKMLHSLNVEGLTVKETQALIDRAYVEVLKILEPDTTITVSLIRPRVVRVIATDAPIVEEKD